LKSFSFHRKKRCLPAPEKTPLKRDYFESPRFPEGWLSAKILQRPEKLIPIGSSAIQSLKKARIHLAAIQGDDA
jgi:hypothetical protein